VRQYGDPSVANFFRDPQLRGTQTLNFIANSVSASVVAADDVPVAAAEAFLILARRLASETKHFCLRLADATFDSELTNDLTIWRRMVWHVPCGNNRNMGTVIFKCDRCAECFTGDNSPNVRR